MENVKMVFLSLPCQKLDKDGLETPFSKLKALKIVQRVSF